MIRPGHLVTGFLLGAVTAHTIGLRPVGVILVATASTATAAGWASPDLDQTRVWRRLSLPLPSSWARHRGITHWWGLPVAAWLTASMWLTPTETALALPLIGGWAGHILIDAFFGGVPAWPGGPTVGFRLSTGGRFETFLTRALPVVSVWVIAGCPTPDALHTITTTLTA